MTLINKKEKELLKRLYKDMFILGYPNEFSTKIQNSMGIKITSMGLRFKLIKRYGENVYKEIRESHIKHPNHRKYYERRTN